MSDVEITGSISKICIGDSQRKVEQTRSDLLPLPQGSGAFIVDESVKRGRKAMKHLDEIYLKLTA
jgi:hypothetical protein